MQRLNWSSTYNIMPLFGKEILKWIYAFAVAAVMFLFFCLLLDLFCYAVYGGWRPLLGKWPIFSGTVSSVIYAPVGLVIFLVVCLAGISRIVMGNNVPEVLLLGGKGKTESDTVENAE